jgi:hypothetical protein
MNNTNNGGPAFPSLPIMQEFEGKRLTMTEGLTMRDYFAAKAMQAIYAAQVEWQSTGCPADAESLQVMEDVAGDAYAMADAMLRVREQ